MDYKTYLEHLHEVQDREYQAYIQYTLISDALINEDRMMQMVEPFDWLYIAGIPKSGTTYVAHKLVKMLPHYSFGFPFTYTCDFEQNLSPINFILFKKHRYAVCQTHTPGKYANIELMKRYSIKPVILFRDLRDVLLSAHDHMYRNELKLNPFGRLHEDWYDLDFDQRMRRLVLHFLPNFANWCEMWLENKHKIEHLQVTYEEMMQDKQAFFDKILDFYGKEPSPMPDDDGREMFRFNKGVANRWKSEFPSSLMVLFDEIAGKTQEKMGYG